jgi:hypothetical protein
MTYLAAYPSNEVISQALLILDSHFASWYVLKVVKCRRLCFCLWLSRVLVLEQKNCCWAWKEGWRQGREGFYLNTDPKCCEYFVTTAIESITPIVSILPYCGIYDQHS